MPLCQNDKRPTSAGRSKAVGYAAVQAVRVVCRRIVPYASRDCYPANNGASRLLGRPRAAHEYTRLSALAFTGCAPLRTRPFPILPYKAIASPDRPASAPRRAQDAASKVALHTDRHATPLYAPPCVPPFVALIKGRRPDVCQWSPGRAARMATTGLRLLACPSTMPLPSVVAPAHSNGARIETTTGAPRRPLPTGKPPCRGREPEHLQNIGRGKAPSQTPCKPAYATFAKPDRQHGMEASLGTPPAPEVARPTSLDEVGCTPWMGMCAATATLRGVAPTRQYPIACARGWRTRLGGLRLLRAGRACRCQCAASHRVRRRRTAGLSRFAQSPPLGGCPRWKVGRGSMGKLNACGRALRAGESASKPETAR